MAIKGLEGVDAQQLAAELRAGGRFVLFEYVISVIVIALKRASDIYYLRPGESALSKAWRYILITFFLGWWSPTGLVWSFVVLVRNFAGGRDVTKEVEGSLDELMGETAVLTPPASPTQPAPSPASPGLVCLQCGASLRPGAAVCGKCGFRLSEAVPGAAANCPRCGAALRSGAMVCGKCGARVGEAEAGPAAAANCPRCGAALRPGAVVCGKCGARVGEAEEESPVCPRCGAPVEEDWRICPHCREKLVVECPACAKRVERSWRTCPYCGRDLPVSRTGEGEREESAAPDTRSCPQCGTPAQAGWITCPVCATRLVDTCPSCGTQVQEGWKVCPFCESDLSLAT